ncbi:serine hydrolase [Oxalobacter paraformigenes]|uniref:serine hydrolase n=1 Tax=Oxalobacter paraformigenes TaxID=556268 RepID=UPI0002D73ADC|nr:serine hydrolase [Oxalobacter paraformigenes]
MHKILSGLLSLIILCVFTAPLGLAATKKAGKTSFKKTAAKTVPSGKKGKSTPVARQKAVPSKRKNARIVSTRHAKKPSKRVVTLDRRTSHNRSRAAYRKVSLRRSVPVVPRYSFGDLAGLKNTYDPLSLKSNAALVLDESNLEILFEKNSDIALPMASITKLMTALVVVESMQDMNEILEITEEDVDVQKHTSSRLRVGTKMTRANLLHLALMSSENRAAAALGRNYPGGISAFVNAMNIKAQVLGMSDSRYVDSSGLSSGNIASARDLAKLVMAAAQYPILRKYSTDTYYSIDDGLREMHYGNTNGLVHNPEWHIRLQKTGYISEAGQCLVMQAVINGRPIVMVFLDSKGKGARLADAQRIRSWLTQSETSITEPRV